MEPTFSYLADVERHKACMSGIKHSNEYEEKQCHLTFLKRSLQGKLDGY